MPVDDADALSKRIDGIPTLPIVATRIAEVIHSKTVSVQAVAEALRPDPGLSAKLLKLVNSPYYGIPGGITDVARAIPFIGFNTLYQLVLSVSVFEILDARTTGFDPRAAWMHSLTAATAARELAIEIRHADPGTCFTAALLHDIGKFGLAKIDPERFSLVHDAVAHGMSQHEAEERFGLASHDHVGGQLAKHWRFPAALAVPIRRHHDVLRADQRERIPPQVRTTAEVVAVADAIAKRCATTFVPETSPEHDDETAALTASLGYTATQLDGLRDRTCQSLERSKVFLTVLESAPTPARATGPQRVAARR